MDGRHLQLIGVSCLTKDDRDSSSAKDRRLMRKTSFFLTTYLQEQTQNDYALRLARPLASWVTETNFPVSRDPSPSQR